MVTKLVAVGPTVTLINLVAAFTASYGKMGELIALELMIKVLLKIGHGGVETHFISQRERISYLMTSKISTVSTPQWVKSVGGPQLTIIYSHCSMKRRTYNIIKARTHVPIDTWKFS